jgi:hypothetical protein
MIWVGEVGEGCEGRFVQPESEMMGSMVLEGTARKVDFFLTSQMSSEGLVITVFFRRTGQIWGGIE